jgi:hypothetical protein
MELKPISKQTIFDYRLNKDVDIRNFTTNDFYLDIEHSTPHAGFALRFNDDKTNGFYVEIGSSHWKKDNNTYILEKHFNWNGVGIEIVEDLAKEYNDNRLNECIKGDAMLFNWDKYFEENNFPKRIDYLQIDIDKTPPYANLLALLNLPLSRYRFSTITIEHCYNHDLSISKVRDIQREILFSYGYKIVAAGFNEDWWIDGQLNIGESEYLGIISETWRGKFI